jgi:YhcH/YjgK/YiaL family protein
VITDRIENLTKYELSFPIIGDLMKILDSTPLSDITKKETFGPLVLVPIISEAVADTFDKSVLEAHKTFMDIHITLDGVDVIAYADLEHEATIFKAYEEVKDYLFVNSNQIKIITVPKGYFCIIPNNFAHMALYDGHARVKKVVVKMPAHF